MTISVFDLFSIGIGPSSSHTVGPMRAAKIFLENLEDQLDQIASIKVHLYGSLGATAKGHGTNKAVQLGLMGEIPESVDVNDIPDLLQQIRDTKELKLMGGATIPFHPDDDILRLPREQLKFHPNGMRFVAFNAAGEEISNECYFSVGGGFVVSESEAKKDAFEKAPSKPVPYPFASAAELLALCEKHDKSISDIMYANEKVWRSGAQIRAALLEIWQVMQDCIHRGCHQEGEMPGLRVKKRAAGFYRKLADRPEATLADPLSVLDWVNLYALAVNEENASGGRVVTAPTNGAAGIVPAVLMYFDRFCKPRGDDDIIRFLLTAGAIGSLFKLNASISGAEVGCQGEVGSACAMAAAGLAEVSGGTPAQVENAAEIGMEHNLGLTCDPVGGLVQVPCIERNAMGAIKAINATRIALKGDGDHFISLDKVIKTMRITGRDMKTKYKETGTGGLAKVVQISSNVVDC